MNKSKPNNLELTKEEIREVAESLDCGQRCFYNVRTKELRTIINTESWIGADEELFQEELDEIESNWQDYFEFEGMDSHESFQIMVGFAEEVDNENLKNKLFRALDRSRPFRNFKWEIDNSGEYRQKWFDFKNEKYIQWVLKQIESYHNNPR